MTTHTQNVVQPIGMASNEISYLADGEEQLSSQSLSGYTHHQSLVSERVQALASTIYQELEAIIHRYDEDAVKKLMPVVVSALEQLDLALSSHAELQAEAEILRDDNAQLLAQYEREKAERKSVAARCNEVEDAKEDEIKQLRDKLDSLESIVRLMDARLKNANDQGSRSEERYEELKREYGKMHDRYAELFRSHVEYVDRTKSLFGIDRSDSQSTIDRVRRTVQIAQSYRAEVIASGANTNAALADGSPTQIKRLSSEISGDEAPSGHHIESNRNSADLNNEFSRLNNNVSADSSEPNNQSANQSVATAGSSVPFVGGELDMEAEVSRIEPAQYQSDGSSLHAQLLSERDSQHGQVQVQVQEENTLVVSANENDSSRSLGLDTDRRIVARLSSAGRPLPRISSPLRPSLRVPKLLERTDEESQSQSSTVLRKSQSISALNKHSLKNFYSLTSTEDLFGTSERADYEFDRADQSALDPSEVPQPETKNASQSQAQSQAQMLRPMSIESEGGDVSMNLSMSLNMSTATVDATKSSLYQEIASTGALGEMDYSADLSVDYDSYSSSYSYAPMPMSASALAQSHTHSQQHARISMPVSASVSAHSRPHARHSSSESHRRWVASSDALTSTGGEPDFSGMRTITEHLIKENIELLEKKNALNVLKDDLLGQIEEANSERMLLKAEIESLNTVKSRMKLRISELEDDVRRLREEVANEKRRRSDVASTGGSERLDSDVEADPEGSVPYSQRRRFTRLEMARVLMERNMYKERLYELQESIRYAEMMRAARQHPDVLPINRTPQTQSTQPILPKKKSSVWNLFSGLFSSGGAQSTSKPKPAGAAAASSIWYTPSSSTTPTGASVSRRASSANETPQTASSILKRHALLQSVLDLEQSGNVPRRRAHYEERHAAYRRIRDHLQLNDGQLLTAYGWSLPAKMQTRLDAEGKAALVEIPVPVYVRPLDTVGGMKIWCAAAVNLSGFDQSPVVLGESAADDAHPVTEKRESEEASQRTSLFRFEREIERAVDDLRACEAEREALTSIVWVSATLDAASSQVVIVDVNNRSEILARFTVSSDQLTAICSVPGHRLATDYASRPAHLIKAAELQPAQPEEDANRSANANPRRLEESAASPSKMVTSTVGGQPKTSRVKRNEDNDSLDSVDEEQQTNEHGGNNNTDSISVASAAVQSTSVELEEISAGTIPTQLPTVWLGSANGWVYVHSAVASWRRCLAAVRLPDAVLAITHANGRVFVALADGHVVVFFRDPRSHEWDVTRYALVSLGGRRAVRCLQVVAGGTVWCAAGNRVHVVDAESLEIVRAFDAHPRKDSHVRHAAWCGDGVWLSMRLDSTLRLFHAFTYEHLQDVDVEPLVARVLGPTAFPLVRITAMMVSCGRLWIGTADGITLTIPFSNERNAVSPFANAVSDSMCTTSLNPGGLMRVLYEDAETQRIMPGTSFVPRVSEQLASLTFHCHRDAIRFFVSAPTRSNTTRNRRTSVIGPAAASNSIAISSDSVNASRPDGAKSERGATTDGWLVVSGGEGYIDVRHGDPDDSVEAGTGTDADAEEHWKQRILASKQERSHLIVWQIVT